jgi:integrase
MGTKIDSVASRARLGHRREPYWHRARKGRYVGFRKMTADSAGSWVARALQDGGRQAYKALGAFDTLPDHQRFDAALKAAHTWFADLDKGVTTGPASVRIACDRYVDYLRATKGAKAADDAKVRFATYVLHDPRLAGTELAALTPLRMEAWRKALGETPTRSGPRRGERRTDSTLNRDMTSFRAALNLAYKDGLVSSDFAWRGKLLPIKNADRRRDLYLDRVQRRLFVRKAAPDLAAFLKGLALVPIRPGALAALTVADFDKRLSQLRVGRDKAGGDRKIKLPPKTAAFFASAAKDKLPAAPLLARADGSAWNKDAWKWPVKAAAAAADLPPATTAYALRHSVITDLVTGGLDLLTIAQISGTSVAMIERHYGHLRADHAAAALAKLAL